MEAFCLEAGQLAPGQEVASSAEWGQETCGTAESSHEASHETGTSDAGGALVGAAPFCSMASKSCCLVHGFVLMQERLLPHAPARSHERLVYGRLAGQGATP